MIKGRNICQPTRRQCVLLLIVVFVGCSKQQQPVASVQSQGKVEASKNSAWVPPSTDGYVGSERCSQCHQQIAETYRSHPMANSIRAVSESLLDVSEKGSDQDRVDGITRFYEVESDSNGKMFHHEKMIDQDGQLIFDQGFEMHFEVGSGQRAFAYLHQQNDLLFQSPINWYSQTQQWDLSPGYQKDDSRRFRRRITDECLSCHAGRANTTGRALNRFGNPAFHEMTIGCENCHGPGAQHVAIHENGAFTPGVVDPIVNPIKLGHSARESVCNQCHLQASARVLRPGRTHFDFRPGIELEDIWTVLDQGVDVSNDGQTRAVNHVQQMRASNCYIGSEGAMGCVSCHDPHGLPSPAIETAFYRDRCYKCHEQEDCVETMVVRSERDNSCVACHMPYRTSNNISHVTQTDHRILRQPLATAPSKLNRDGDLTFVFFDQADKKMESWESQRAAAAALWIHMDKKGRQAPPSLAKLLAPTLEVNPEDPLALTILGALANQHGRIELAKNYFETASILPAGEESSVSGLLTIHYLNSDWDDALRCANRMIELNPQEARFHALRADILANLDRLAEGIAAAEKSLQLDPTVIPVREWLVNKLQADGRMQQYSREFALLNRMKDVVREATSSAAPLEIDKAVQP